MNGGRGGVGPSTHTYKMSSHDCLAVNELNFYVTILGKPYELL